MPGKWNDKVDAFAISCEAVHESIAVTSDRTPAFLGHSLSDRTYWRRPRRVIPRRTAEADDLVWTFFLLLPWRCRTALPRTMGRPSRSAC